VAIPTSLPLQEFETARLLLFFGSSFESIEAKVTGIRIADPNLSPVPLPSSAWTFLASFAVLAGIAHRRRRSASK
jgi:hypothetical protein